MNVILIALLGIAIEIGFNVFLIWYMWPILSIFQYIRKHHIKIDPEQYLGIAPASAETKEYEIR